ncbi:5'-methylthioadenosine/adenosylhomocysteine nucleosidase [Paenibacillus eucommiae]|uniref:5'-methylthioadenosine/adenosylhomocysteine nucleosidase n=1 Tax=Paenibacillus eucommiae TaxID=1355755 RepID=UPI001AE66240|nr:5'-methylthioadenosine/adenosylhomocysteine nucleosidase [Paenibacillus eucommiae]
MGFARIALIGAMNEEIELLLQHMEHTKPSSKAGIAFYEGTFLGREVVVCKTGVGKVNAAITTQILIDQYGVDSVIFTGVAGALDPQLNIGDIVISDECMQHDMDVTALGFNKGIIPYADKSIFAADVKLVELAVASGNELFSERVKRGRILSGDQFIANRDVVADLHQHLGGVCVEMEGAAVAQVCSINEIPFVIIRSMSDKADGSAHVNFAEFTLLAAENSYKIVEDIVRKLE